MKSIYSNISIPQISVILSLGFFLVACQPSPKDEPSQSTDIGEVMTQTADTLNTDRRSHSNIESEDIIDLHKNDSMQSPDSESKSLKIDHDTTISRQKKMEVSKPKATPITSSPKVKEQQYPIVFFPDTIHDFGFINEGDTIRHTFRFLNKGQSPLEITDVQVSCGCTVPIYSLEPILPGRMSTIDITYLSTGKVGRQQAIIDVHTNAQKSVQKLYLKGVVR